MTLAQAKSQAHKQSRQSLSNRDKANAYRGVALLAIELKEYDIALEYGEMALSFCEDKYVGDIQVIQDWVIKKAWKLKEIERRLICQK